MSGRGRIDEAPYRMTERFLLLFPSCQHTMVVADRVRGSRVGPTSEVEHVVARRHRAVLGMGVLAVVALQIVLHQELPVPGNRKDLPVRDLGRSDVMKIQEG